MNRIQRKIKLMFLTGFFFLTYFQPSIAIEAEGVNVYFNRDISTFSSEDELLSYFEKMEEYTQVDKTYSEEKEIEKKRISTQIIDGLSVDEIGDIPALTIGGDSGLNSLDIELKPYDDYFLALSYDGLYSIKPNQDSINAPEIISEIILPEHEETFSYEPLIIENDLLIVAREIRYHNHTELLSYNINSDGELALNQRYVISASNFGVILEVKVVGDSLVFITSSDIYSDSLNENDLFSPLTAIRYVDDSEEEVDITSSIQLINTANDIRNWSKGYDRYYSNLYKSTNVISCPLNGLDKGSLECDLTSLLGVNSISNSWFDINDGSVYIWSDSNPKLDYENLSINDYSDFIRSEEGIDLFNKVLSSDYYKTVYRVDLANGQVEGALVDGAPVSYGSLQGSADVFSGIFSSKESDGVDNVNGVRFESNDFSNQVKEPTSDKYQNLIKSSEIRYRGSIENKAILLSANEVKGQEKISIFSWDRENKDFSQLNASSNLNIIEVYVVANNLLIIGQVDNNHLVIETWSVEGADEILDRVKIEKYAHEYTHIKDLFFERHEEDYFFIIEAALKSDIDKKTNNTNQPVSRVLPFIKSADGTLSNVGGFIASSEDDCIDELLCFLNQTNYRALVLDDYIYILVYGEIHKIKYSSGELVLLSRLDLRKGETVTE